MEKENVKVLMIRVMTGAGEKTYSKVQYKGEDKLNYAVKITDWIATNKVVRFMDAIHGTAVILNLHEIELIEIDEVVSTVATLHGDFLKAMKIEGYELDKESKQFYRKRGEEEQ